MRAFPFRALSLALTLSLGFSLIGSAMIWTDTGVRVTIDEYFDENAFQMLVTNPPGDTEEVDAAAEFAESSNFVQGTSRINSTVGLVYGTSLPDNTVYGKNSPIYTDGIKDCEVIFVDNSFLERSKGQFEIEGRFALEEGEALVSTQFVNYVYEVFEQSLTLNSTISVEVLTRRPTFQEGEIGDLGRNSLESLKIVGIYEIEGFSSIIETAFPSIQRSNYDYIHLDSPVLGIRDSIMVLSSSIDTSNMPEVGFFGAKSFISASSGSLVAAGLETISENLITLKTRIEQQYSVIVEGLDEVLYLQELVDTYIETMPLALLNLPIFILALFLCVFAADTFMATRKTEVSALRSKGASSKQIYGVFFAESVLISLFSIGLGLFLSILFAALIPAATGFMSFDLTVYSYYLSNTVLNPQSILITVLICILPPLLFILHSSRTAALTEIGSHLMETADTDAASPPAYRFTIGASTVLLALVMAAVLFVPGNPILLLVEIGLGTAAWFFLSYNGSRITRVGFAKFTSRLSFLLGEKNIISTGNLKMRKGRIVPLMVALSLTLSSTIAFTVQAESFQADLKKEVAYALGADLRVGTTARPFSFSETLEEYPGISRATPVLKTWAKLGTERFTLEAVDATEYSLIGNFDPSSFYGEDSTFMLSRLSSTPNGIIISRYHANRWNKSIGDSLSLRIGGRLQSVYANFQVVGFVQSAPGFGYAAEEMIPPSRLGPAFGFQAKYSGFGIANLDFISTQGDFTSTDLFLCDLVCVTDQELVIRALTDIPGVSATTTESFDLEEYSFGTALFLSTVEGLFSIGFAMSLILSMFALTLFLGSVVRERKRDYAILRAVGGSKSQIIRVVLSEFSGIVFASLTLSLVLGTIFGYVMSAIVFSMSPFARVLQAIISFPIGFLTAVLLIEIGAMIAGAYWPAVEASKTDPAIVLRNL